jgi:hypothetical protein
MSVSTVEYADAMDFTADDELVVYDALNNLEARLRRPGRGVEHLRTRSRHGNVFAIVAPQPGVDVGFPALAQRSDSFLVFDAYESVSGTGSVMAANLDTGDLTMVATDIGGSACPATTATTRMCGLLASRRHRHRLLAAGAGGLGGSHRSAPRCRGPRTATSTVYRRGTFVPEPEASVLGVAAAVVLTVLARRRARIRDTDSR